MAERRSLLEHAAASKGSGPANSLGGSLGLSGQHTAQPEPMARPSKQESRMKKAWKRLNANDNSWFVFKEDNPVRRVAKRLTGHPVFGQLVMTIIFANCVVMAMQQPICDDACKHSTYSRVLDALDMAFTFSFTAEILCHTVARCFLFGKDAYLHSAWGWLDLLATASGYIAFLPNADGSGINGLRALRALRPLKAINALPGLKRLVGCMLDSLMMLTNVFFLMIWVFFCFGIVALNVFMGRLQTRCMYQLPLNASAPAAPPPLLGAAAAIATAVANTTALWGNATAASAGADGGGEWLVVPGLEETPCSIGRVTGAFKCPWEYAGYEVVCKGGNANPSFGLAGYDNFGQASLNIFSVITLDNWTAAQMYLLWQAMGPGVPIAFFACLVFFGAFFALQLLVAVLSTKFAEIFEKAKEAEEAAARAKAANGDDAASSSSGAPTGCLAPLKRWWAGVRQKYLRPTQARDMALWRRRVWALVRHRWFNHVMMALVIVNTVVLGMDHTDIPPDMKRVLEMINNVLTFIFFAEMALKHVGMGFVRYWRSPWNAFDGVVVVVSLAELIVLYIVGSKGGVQALRAFRLLRVLRGITTGSGLRRLLRLIIQGFATLKDFFLLTALFIFVFSILGTQQFAGSSGFADTRSNFNTLWEAAYTVFQLLTCDDWLAITYNGVYGVGPAAALYFVAWAVLGNFILLALFLAILIAALEDGFGDDEDDDSDREREAGDMYGDDDGGSFHRKGGQTSDDASGHHGAGGGSDVEAPPAAAAAIAVGGADGDGDAAGGVREGGSGRGGSHGHGHGGNALQHRLAVDLSERLDPHVVHLMKRWLVMTGVTYGISQGEVATITRELDERYALDPSSVTGASSFTAPIVAPALQPRVSVGPRQASMARRRTGDVLPHGGASGGGLNRRSLKLTDSTTRSFGRKSEGAHAAAGEDGAGGDAGDSKVKTPGWKLGALTLWGKKSYGGQDGQDADDDSDQGGGGAAARGAPPLGHKGTQLWRGSAPVQPARRHVGGGDGGSTAVRSPFAEYTSQASLESQPTPGRRGHGAPAGVPGPVAEGRTTQYGTADGGAAASAAWWRSWQDDPREADTARQMAEAAAVRQGGDAYGSGATAAAAAAGGRSKAHLLLRGLVGLGPGYSQQEQGGSKAYDIEYGRDRGAEGDPALLLPCGTTFAAASAGPAAVAEGRRVAVTPTRSDGQQSGGRNGGSGSGAGAAPGSPPASSVGGDQEEYGTAAQSLASSFTTAASDPSALVLPHPQEPTVQHEEYGSGGSHRPGPGSRSAPGTVPAYSTSGAGVVAAAAADLAGGGGGAGPAPLANGFHRRSLSAQEGSLELKLHEEPADGTAVLGRQQQREALGGGRGDDPGSGSSADAAVLYGKHALGVPYVTPLELPAQYEAYGGDAGAISARGSSKDGGGPPKPLKEKEARRRLYARHQSFWVLSYDHPVRQACSRIITPDWFDHTILTVIILSSITLAIDTPRVDPDSRLARGMFVLDAIFTSIFALEMVLKMITYGVVLHKGSYLRSPWDVLDFIIVWTSIVTLALTSLDLGGLRVLRLIRILRPLRLITRLNGMRRVVETLLQSLPSLFNVALFGTFLFVIWAIVGVQLFAGTMSKCNQAFIDGARVTDRSQCVEGVVFTCTPDDLCSEEGAELARWWGPPLRNFDHMGRSLLTLFTVSTGDDFMAVARFCIDAVGVNKMPQPRHRPYAGLYVIVFVFLGNFFWVNLVVSIVVGFYSQVVQDEKEKMSGEGFLVGKRAKEFVKIFRLEQSDRAEWRFMRPTTNRLRRMCYDVASPQLFDYVMLVIIALNLITMVLIFDGSPPEYDKALQYVNIAFIAIFATEAAIKIIAQGFPWYIKWHWNKLDLFIVLVSVPDIVATFVPMGTSTSTTMLRILRMARIFKIIRSAKGLRTLFNTLITSLPAIGNVGSLLLLLMYIYAVLGINLFGDTGNAFEDAGQDIANFNHVGFAMATLFRAFTGDGWGDLMAVAMGCNDFGYQCDASNGQAWAATLFFCSFMLLASFVMLNLVIAVVLDNFLENMEAEGLLQKEKFVDVMLKAATLRVFVRMTQLNIRRLDQEQRRLDQRYSTKDGRSRATVLLSHSARFILGDKSREALSSLRNDADPAGNASFSSSKATDKVYDTSTNNGANTTPNGRSLNGSAGARGSAGGRSGVSSFKDVTSRLAAASRTFKMFGAASGSGGGQEAPPPLSPASSIGQRYRQQHNMSAAAVAGAAPAAGPQPAQLPLSHEHEQEAPGPASSSSSGGGGRSRFFAALDQANASSLDGSSQRTTASRSGSGDAGDDDFTLPRPPGPPPETTTAPTAGGGSPGGSATAAAAAATAATAISSLRRRQPAAAAPSLEGACSLGTASGRLSSIQEGWDSSNSNARAPTAPARAASSGAPPPPPARGGHGGRGA